MIRTRQLLALPLVVAATIAASACGAENDSTADNATASVPEVSVAESEADVEPVEQADADDHDDDHDDDEEHGDDDHESGGLGAHEHGTAELSVAWIDAEVAIDLISPTFNVFGFEYEPTSDEDLAIEADRTAALTATGIITVNDEAGCTLVDAVDTEVEREGSHSEIVVSWRFSCDDPDAVERVDASGLFEEFPNFDDVDAQWISDSDQSAAELSPSSTTLTLRR